MGSTFLNLNWADLGKGLLMAFLTIVVTGLYTSLSATPPHFPTGAEWGTLLLMGLASAVAYLIKNVFTNSSGEVLKKEK